MVYQQAANPTRGILHTESDLTLSPLQRLAKNMPETAWLPRQVFFLLLLSAPATGVVEQAGSRGVPKPPTARVAVAA